MLWSFRYDGDRHTLPDPHEAARADFYRRGQRQGDERRTEER